MSLQDFQMLDNEPFDICIIERDVLENYHH